MLSHDALYFSGLLFFIYFHLLIFSEGCNFCYFSFPCLVWSFQRLCRFVSSWIAFTNFMLIFFVSISFLALFSLPLNRRAAVRRSTIFVFLQHSSDQAPTPNDVFFLNDADVDEWCYFFLVCVKLVWSNEEGVCFHSGERSLFNYIHRLLIHSICFGLAAT